MIDFLATVRPGLFQFEIGVQSTNPDTIREIRRTTDTQKLLAICRELDRPKNIHLHLDLIAGLPFEDLASFGRSFDTVMQIRPQQMQLGFLKVLKGSYMEQAAPSYGLEYSRRPPFQVIRTRWISFDDLLLLRDMENAVEDYYNSSLFPAQIGWMLDQEESAFSFFMDLGQFLVQRGLRLLPQSPEDRCTNLKDFYLTRHPDRARPAPLLHDLCLFDLCLHGRPRKLPDWVSTRAQSSLPKAAAGAIAQRRAAGRASLRPGGGRLQAAGKIAASAGFRLRPAHRAAPARSPCCSITDTAIFWGQRAVWRSKTKFSLQIIDNKN